MKDFIKALDTVINACSALSVSWEKLSNEASESVLDKYPFEKDFREVVSSMVDWRDSLK